MNIGEIIREQIRINDMKGIMLTKFIASPQMMQELIAVMKSDEDYSDVASRLYCMERKIDKNLPANEFRFQGKALDPDKMCKVCQVEPAGIGLSLKGPEVICSGCYYSGSPKSIQLLGFDPSKNKAATKQ
jgi:hypothetical protein